MLILERKKISNQWPKLSFYIKTQTKADKIETENQNNRDQWNEKLTL